ncbi:MAG: serine acetyltransferase [Acidobacteria bacterium]|nr:serine acetyltransferase [Acidobacteriota bacterium]MBI3425545.1 serine acetyltransferase [Acidobacteriota bacterium]
MNWLSNYQQDLARYTEYAGGGALLQLLAQQGLWALLQYRLAAAVYQSGLPRLLKRPLLASMTIWQKLIEIFTGISLPYTAVIGPGLYIGHFGHIILNGNAVLGAQCNLSQGVTIGVSGRGVQRGVPRIGARVYIGANAVIAGQLTIGNDVVIGANTLVTADVPDNCTVVGVPGQIVSRKGSQDYLCPQQLAKR